MKLTQSLKTNARIPPNNSVTNNMVRKIAYCLRERFKNYRKMVRKVRERERGREIKRQRGKKERK